MVQQDLCTYSPEYTPASPSPPRHRVTGAKVGRGKVLTPPLDHTGTDLPPSLVRRHIRPPPIRGPIEVHAYTTLDVHASALAGWTGKVVPRLVTGARGHTVEFSGDGAVFVEEPR